MSYVKVTDTRLMQLQPQDSQIVVKEGAQNIAYIPLTSAAFSTQNATFNLNNIASQVCRDRRININVPGIIFTVNVTGTTTGQSIFGSLGYKSWPYNRCINNISHQINQASYSLNLNQIIDSITKCNITSEDANFYDNTAYDCVSNYANATGSGLDPLLPYNSVANGWGVFKPRTSNITLSANQITTGGTPQNILITCNIYEPLCSPFNNVGKDDDHALYGINGEIIQIQHVNDIFNNMLAATLTAGITINSVVVTFPTQASLELRYLTPPQDFVVPNTSISHYNNYSIFNTNFGTVNANSAPTFPITSSVCQLTNVPYKILVYVKDATQNIAVPDRYLQIRGVSFCQFDNGANQLSSATINDLYNVSQSAGYMPDRDVWQQNLLNQFSTVPPGAKTGSYGSGSVLVLDPKIHLGLRNDISDGSPGRFIFQITLNCFNNTGDNFPNTSLYIVAVTNAVLERQGSEYRNYLLSLEPNAIMVAKQMAPISHCEYMRSLNQNMFLSGGSFKSWWKRGIEAAKHAAKSGIDYAIAHPDQVLKYGKQAASLIGLGDECYEAPQHMGQSFRRGRNPSRKMDLFYN